MNYILFMYIISIILSISSIFITSIKNPSIGFSVVITIFIILDLFSLNNKEAIKVCYGNIKKGGIRRSIFTREMVSIAMLYSSISSFIQKNINSGIFSLLLASALIIASIANEIEARKKYFK